MNILKAAEDFLASVARALNNTVVEAGVQDEAPEEETADDIMEDDADDMTPSQTVRATIRSARREMDPVTLQGWSRVIFACEDGEERKMYFPGENGVFLTAGETGLLEHRDGAFVCFEKDSGEIVGALYHILPEED